MIYIYYFLNLNMSIVFPAQLSSSVDGKLTSSIEADRIYNVIGSIIKIKLDE